MRGRTLARMAALLQAVLLAGALIVPASVAAATLGFSLNPPTLSTVAYSDLVVLRGAYTCVNDGVSNCSTGTQSHTATFSLRPAGGSTFTTVGTVVTSFSFTSSAGGCPSTCSVPFQVTWKAGRAGAVTIPPGVYDIGLTNTIAAGQQVLLNGLTVAAEATTTTYSGLASGMGGTSVALSATIADQDRGLSVGTGIFSPDANLFGANLVTFELYDAANTTLVVGPVSATLLGTGLVTGSPSLVLPAAGGTFKLRTTFVGNSFYTTSGDLDTITVTSSNTPPELTVPLGLMVAEATSPVGKAITYSVSANDAEDDPDPTPTCLPASGSVFPIGDTTVTCSVTDSGDLTDTDTFVVSVVDTLNPGVGIGSDEADNGAGWYNAASNDGEAGVTVNVVTGDAVGVTALSCTDRGVDVGALDPAGDEFVIGDGNHDIECTVTDAADNDSTDTASFAVDQTAPTISASLTPDASDTGWWNLTTAAPTVTFSCADATSGSGLASCTDPSSFGEGADQAHSGAAVDIAGNSSTTSVMNIDVDLTSPANLSFTGGALAAGGAYAFGSVPAGPTGCTATDSISGLSACEVAGYSVLVGPHTITGIATDAAGNQAVGSFSYSVLPWTLRGFGNPISTTSVNLVKAGTTSNLKFEAFSGTSELTSLDVVTDLAQTQVSCATQVPVGPTTSALGSKGNALKFDGGQYMAKWDAPSQPGTCWLVSIVTRDGSSLSAAFQLR
ncbi:MAG TPA: PxKF domain-containing protein [Candidatus Limnocylindria bacterium]|nr:PxKF domain-containing protein [Candidatus Limnocylindria bacterium]